MVLEVAVTVVRAAARPDTSAARTTRGGATIRYVSRRSRGPQIVAAVAVASFALAACGQTGRSAGLRTPTAPHLTVSASLAARPAQGTGHVKPTLVGLVTMGDMNWTDNPDGEPLNRLLEASTHPGVYAAAVIQATWKELEPRPGVFDDSAIQAALQRISAYNKKYPKTPLVGKLRVFPGVHSPAWVLEAVGSVRLVNHHTGTAASYPDFWKPEYSRLWTELQDHLATVYDRNDLIGEVAVTSCSSFSGEPFNNGQGSFFDSSTLIAAGYTDTQYENCLSNAASNYAAWKLTPVDFPFNELMLMQTHQIDSAFSIKVMAAFRKALGTRAVVANEDFDVPLPKDLAPIYDEIQELRHQAWSARPRELSPLEFQVLGPTIDWAAVVPAAIGTYHPTEIEVWSSTATRRPGGYADITEAQLQRWSAELKVAAVP